MAEATLSSKNQIVVPREAREVLNVKAGDKLLLVVRGQSLVVLPRPASYSRATQGLSKRGYPARYLESERRSWD